MEFGRPFSFIRAQEQPEITLVVVVFVVGVGVVVVHFPSFARRNNLRLPPWSDSFLLNYAVEASVIITTRGFVSDSGRRVVIGGRAW